MRNRHVGTIDSRASRLAFHLWADSMFCGVGFDRASGCLFVLLNDESLIENVPADFEGTPVMVCDKEANRMLRPR
jgi:hypothetical protein